MNSEVIIILLALISIALLILGAYWDSKKKRESFTLETKDYSIVYIYANFGSRLLARIIDVLIIIIPSSIIPIIPAWLYWCLQESGNKRTTVGKKTQQLYVMTTNGKRISFGRASGRFIGLILTGLTMCIGILFMFFSKKRQCFHDLMTNTVVVKEIQRIPKKCPDLS